MKNRKTYLQTVAETLKSQDLEDYIFAPNVSDLRIVRLAEVINVVLETKINYYGLESFKEEVLGYFTRTGDEQQTERERVVNKLQKITPGPGPEPEKIKRNNTPPEPPPPRRIKKEFPKITKKPKNTDKP